MKTPKEMLLDALIHQPTPSIPWVPYAGVHAGFLKGYDCRTVLTDGDKLLESLLEVNRIYKPSGQPVVFDLQIEAEILGCELLWSEDAPPSVRTHPLAETTSVPCLCTLPTEKDGRLPMVLDVTRRLKEKTGESTALYGLICGPFTLASHLRGSEIFMDMYDEPEYLAALLEYCTAVGKRMTEFYIKAGVDVVAVVDPLVSQISSDHFEEFLSKPFSELFAHIRALNAVASFFVCGNATRNIEVMCQTNPHSISVDENVDIVAAKIICDRYNVSIGGNVPLTTVMLHGTQQDNMKFVIDLIDRFEGNTEGLILAPGCDMPYSVPPENVIAVGQAVLQPETTRILLEHYIAPTDDLTVELPDYTNLARPLVEVFTLDSKTCAACTYMMASADEAKSAYRETIDVVEYKYTRKEDIARIKKMGVKNLPSIYVNGELKFSSLIPSRQELHAVIDEALAKQKAGETPS